MNLAMVAASVAVLVILVISVRIYQQRRERARKNLVYRAVKEQHPKVLPCDVLAHVNQNEGIAMDQGELIHLLYQLIDDNLVQKNELSAFDRAQLARRSLKGIRSCSSGFPIRAMKCMARFSLTQEEDQQAA
jgi:hypothetical protein